MHSRCSRPLVALSLLLSGWAGAASGIGSPAAGVPSAAEEPVPVALRPYISRMSAPLRRLELPDYVDGELPRTISKQQALEDIDMLQYLFDNAYSGRDYWQQNGVDFPRAYQALRDFVSAAGTPEIDTLRLEERIYSELGAINDPHTAILGHEVREFFTRIRQYFASFVVAKERSFYRVVQSGDRSVPVGAELVGGADRLFPTLSPSGAQHFLFGIMSAEAPASLDLELRSGKVRVAVHPCRIGEIQYDRFNDIIAFQRIEGIPVVRSSSFWVEGKVKELEAFSESGKQLRGEPVFVWNLLANDGGSSQYPSMFIENFNGFVQEESWEAHLHSTPIAEAYLPGKNGWSPWPKEWLDDKTPLSEIPEYKRDHVQLVRKEKVDLIENPRRFWTLASAKPEHKVGDYPGRVVILSNYRNGSAGNNALAMSKSIPHSVIVGENSNSTYAFANTRNFSLKHSRIKLRLPGRLFIHPQNKMERGFLPDYWLDSASPVEEVVRWIAHPVSYQFRYPAVEREAAKSP